MSVQLRPKTMQPPSSSATKKCKVLFSYQPTHEDELELKIEDVIDFMGEVEDGWWRGNLNGKTGVFPSNFVEMITAAEKPAVARKRPSAVESAGSRSSQQQQNVESKNKKNENFKGEFFSNLI